MEPGKIDFCHVCSQRFTITAYTKQSVDGEGLLCHKCGSVQQSIAKKDVPKRKRMKVGKGTAKMILEGREDRIGKLQDICIKVCRLWKYTNVGYCETYP
jgi:DNA repair protein RAD7